MKISRGREDGHASQSRTETFTGVVWMDPVLADVPGTGVNAVFFAPGARTHWHSHADGQVLLVTQGRGYVQTRSGDGGWIAAGDVVYSEPGEEHWHGAAPESYLVHTAVSLGRTEWFSEVTDEEYRGSVS